MSTEALAGRIALTRAARSSMCRATSRRWRATRGSIVDAGYAIERVDAFDLFPNTPHVETVVVFAKS